MNLASKKELKVILLVKKEMSAEEIAKKLADSIKTNQIQRQNILKKLNLTTRASLINFFHNYYC
jgi:DNA-binding CsgD family transcriptional regulator